MLKKILFAILMIVVSVSLCAAQKSTEPAAVIKDNANACELNSAYFDSFLGAINSLEERIFVIFRGAKGETETVNAKRLAHVKWFLENRKGWKSFNVIYARGEKSDNEAKIEFYIGGRFYLVVMSGKNRTPCLDCCDGGLEYPQNLVKKKRAKRKS